MEYNFYVVGNNPMRFIISQVLQVMSFQNAVINFAYLPMSGVIL